MTINELLLEVRRLALLDQFNRGKGADSLVRSTNSELGEVCEALSVEMGDKNKDLKESAMEEAVDLVICVVALYFILGGNIGHLCDYGEKKLKKWEKTVH